MNKTFNPSSCLLAALAFCTATIPLPVCATWYSENVTNGSDIMMMDVRWPWWPESTYFANFNFGFNPPGITGYGGFTGEVPTLEPDHRPNLDPEVQAAWRPGSVWSFWGTSKQGEPVQVVASSEYTYPSLEVGEGASAGLGGPVWPFIRQNRWYTMMMRVWKPVGAINPQYSYIGRWVKDVDLKQWRLYGIMRLPVPATSFTGNAGFLEDFDNGGRSVRSMYRRLGYCRKDGKWLKSDTVSYDIAAKRGNMDTYWVVDILPDGNDEVLAMELSSDPTLLPQKLKGRPLGLGKKYAFTVKQSDLPTLDGPGVRDVKAVSNGRQVAVSWIVPASVAPQFAYRIEVFDNPTCQGRPLLVREERMPTVQTVLIDASVAKPTVRLTITDVFDQLAPPVVVTAKVVNAVAPAPVTAVEPGLEYQLLFQDSSRHENIFYPSCEKADFSHNETHHWLSLSEINHGRQIQSGVSRGFDTNLRGERNEGYAFKFKGLLNVPVNGLYLLHVQGADGYRITLDGREALAWDGPHGPTEKTAMLNLAKGDHPLAVDYFVDMAAHPCFKLEWEGPGLSRQEIPVSALVHVQVSQTPQMVLASTGGTNGTATITVKADPKGHQVSKIDLFLGRLQIAEAEGSELSYMGPMPQGESTIWARLVYDGDHTIDSDPQQVEVAGPAVRGWDYAVAGDAKSLHGLWQTGPESFSFFGEGEYVISRKIKGDFTLTCRVDAYAGARGEPVNSLSWVGLTAREDASKNNYGWGREFGLMQTGGSGLHTTPNYTDLGGTRVSDFVLAKDQPWLRVVRQGNQWTAWTSTDGINWENGATYFIPTHNEMDAGLVFRALPQDARTYFQACVSHLNLEPGLAKDIAMPASVAATNTDGPRLTGVVMSPSDPNIVVARSPNIGLLISTNGGQDWATANGTLVGADNCVRSVAIHPQDPKIMLRAAGRTGRNGSFEGGLMLTRDGGHSWENLDFPGDFDGEGPSALCGEVVGFDPANPAVLFAGCETKGFFRSENGGKTWNLIGAVGERITAVTVNRWFRGTANQAYIHVVTCADVWMPLLGRGKPSLTDNPTKSCDYVSQDGGISLNKICERTDLGYLNASSDKLAWPGEMPYATTHGLIRSMNDGEVTFMFPLAKNLECFRPYIALATSGLGSERSGRCLTQALDPVNHTRLSRSDFCAWNWDWETMAGDIPTGGMISICGELNQGNLWWMLATDGLYRSTDGGITLKKVLDKNGVVLGR